MSLSSSTPVLAFIALGSNLGDSRRILREAIRRLQVLSAAPLRQSSFLNTAPEDCPAGSPDFWNAVVALTPLPGETPESLLIKLRALERELGRQPKKVTNEPRPIDLDLIAFGNQTSVTKTLTLPHPRAGLRRFVLQPLAEIAPDLVLPGQTRTVAELLASLPLNLPPLILASASPRRAELLRQLDVEFRVVPSDAAEIHQEQLTAWEVAQINAYRKARAVAKKFPDALVLGADTLVHLDLALFGKPVNREHAEKMLEQLQGRTHHVVTAVCLLHLRSHRQKVFVESSAVTFRPLDARKIGRYLDKVNPLDKAGAYAVQEEGDLIVERVSGSYTNVVGLPLETLRAELAAWSGQERR
jgi:MAF protein/2-amino-4-hydroxy-6-hydroxymethyldihydropteridine diphosphokinase